MTLILRLLFHNFIDYFYDIKVVKRFADISHKGILKICKRDVITLVIHKVIIAILYLKSIFRYFQRPSLSPSICLLKQIPEFERCWHPLGNSFLLYLVNIGVLIKIWESIIDHPSPTIFHFFPRCQASLPQIVL